MPPMNTMSAHIPPIDAPARAAAATRESWLDVIAGWCLIALFGLLPFFFVPVSWLTSLQSKMLLASVLLGVTAILWTVARVIEGGGRMPWNLLFGASAFVPVAYALSAAVNGFAGSSLVGTGVEPDTLAVVCLEFAALTLTALVLGGVERNTTKAIRALVAGVFVLELIHVLHMIAPSVTLGGVLAGETGNAMGTWHEFSMLIGFGLLSSLALYRSSISTGIWKWVTLALGVIAVPILVINNFTDVWIGVAIGSLVILAVRTYQARAGVSVSLLRSEWAAILVAVVGLICILYGAAIVSKLPESVSVVQIEVRPSWQGTFQIGEQSLTSPKEFIFGVGPNTFTREWGLHKPLEVNQTPFWNADFNVGVAPIPTSFISLGIVGVLAWLCYIIAILFVAIGLWIKRREQALSARVLAISVGVVYTLAFHLSSVPGTALGLSMFLMTGLLVAMFMQSNATERTFTLSLNGWKNIATLLAVGLIALISLVASVAIVRAVLADATINRAIVSYNSRPADGAGDPSQQLQRSSDLIARALTIQPSNDRAHRAAVELGLLRLQQLINAKDPNQDAARTALQTTLEETIKHGLTAVEIDGTDYQNWLQLAALYSQLAGAQIQGAYDNARAAYVRAQQENPTSPLPLLNLGQLDALQGNYDVALENLGKAVALKPDLASAYFLASQIYVAKSDANNALLAAAQAARFAPNDPLAWYNAGAIAYAGGDYQDAAIAMQQALALQSQYANAMYVLGLSLYQLKQPQNALQVFEALNQLDPNQPIVLQIIENLRAGRPLETPVQNASSASVK